MSLLLQALQKAAKSREESQGEPSEEALSADDQLALEPIAPEPVLREDIPAAGPTPAQAAAVLDAGRAPGFDPIEYAREHQMLVFLALAVLFAIGYGSYVYIQVANPFRSDPAPAPIVSAPPAAVTAVQPAVEASDKVSGLPMASASTGGRGDGGSVQSPAPAAATSIFDAPAAPGAAAPAPEQPLTQRVVTAREPARRTEGRAAASRNIQSRNVQSTVRTEAADGVETIVIPSTAQQGIAVSRQPTTTVPIDPTLMQAYEALQQGDFARARSLYEQVWQADPKNLDALLGLAAIAARNGDSTLALRYYQNALELDPRNAYAQAGMLSIIGAADPLATESQIKLLIAREPSALLYFALGTLYADQGQWPSAQQAYFQAYQLQPDNPDYAFNLAVGLEHMGQAKAALDYYRKALDLSFRRGRANFDQNLVIQRVGLLSSRVEQ